MIFGQGVLGQEAFKVRSGRSSHRAIGSLQLNLSVEETETRIDWTRHEHSGAQGSLAIFKLSIARQWRVCVWLPGSLGSQLACRSKKLLISIT